MRLIGLWDHELRMIGQAPSGFALELSGENRRKIERLLAFVDGTIENEEEVARHPLASEIRNWAPWNIERLTALSDSLTIAAEHARGFDRVRRSLGKPEHYEDSVSELSLASEFLRAGLKVSFVKETKDKKTSDLSIETDGGTLFVEITRLGQSAETREAFSYFNREDWRVSEFEGLKVDIRMEKFVSRPRLKELLEGVIAEAQAVRLSGSPRSYIAPGLLSARIEKMEQAGKSSFGVAGWPTDSDEVDRLARTLRRKSQQLPTDSPGMLVILDNELHLSPWESPDYSVIVAELEEHVFEHGQMVGVLIVLPFGAPDAKPFNASGEDWIAWRKLGPVLLVEDRIFIRNRYAEGKVDQKILEAVGCPSKSGPQSRSPA